MRSSLLKSNKGVSIMVGYVILIVIAISLSVAVFAFLKLYLPSEKPKCSEDIVLTIESASCVDHTGNGNYNIEIELMNRGFFNVDGAYIRAGEVGRIYKTLLNEDPSALFIGEEGGILAPEKKWKNDFVTMTYKADPTKPQEIEVEPLIFIENKPALCEKATASRIIECIQNVSPPL